MTIRLAQKHFIITGDLLLTPKRTLKAKIKGCDGTVYHSFKRGSPRIDAVIVGNHPYEPIITKARRRGVPLIDEADFNADLDLLEGTSGRLGALRARVHEPPSRENWEAVCMELELWPAGEDVTPGVDYVASHAERWPAELRWAFKRWVTRAASGVEPCLRVVRAVNLGHVAMSTKQVTRVMEQLTQPIHLLSLEPSHAIPFTAALHHPAVEAVTRLTLARNPVYTARTWSAGLLRELAAALRTSPHLGRLEEIEAIGWPLGDIYRDLVGTVNLPSLKLITTQHA